LGGPALVVIPARVFTIDLEVFDRPLQSLLPTTTLTSVSIILRAHVLLAVSGFWVGIRGSEALKPIFCSTTPLLKSQ
jgi:hypothetical protein